MTMTEVRRRRRRLRAVLSTTLALALASSSSSSAAAASRSALDGTFRVATLSIPRRCLHLDGGVDGGGGSDGEGAPAAACADRRDWHDGTNGCAAYASNRDWCRLHGSHRYPTSPRTAREACCACGGGNRGPPRLRPGEHVEVRGMGLFDSCSAEYALRIKGYAEGSRFGYVVEATKPCGPEHVVHVREGGMVRGRMEPSIKAGTTFVVDGDDPNIISKKWRVELRKCREKWGEEQSFVATPLAGQETRGEEGSRFARIMHPLTGVDLASAIAKGKNRNAFEIAPSFDAGAFDGSDDYFYIRVSDGADRGGVTTHSYLASGRFGQREFPEVQLVSGAVHRGFKEQEFSMFQFLPVSKDESDVGEANVAADEHAEWLLRMATMIGIDYLTQLSPWHILDVERDSSKNDVKSRFRDLSRIFHPDKLIDQPGKRELFERIFVLLQSAYQGLKGADEAEKEKFKIEAESGSQLFLHSRYVVELLPFHWTELDIDGVDAGEDSGRRYILNTSSHLNATLSDDASFGEEREPSTQVWVAFMYSARCGMSRTVVGMIDLAARHLRHENILVGAYGCGLYKEHPIKENDLTGVVSDPICAQFRRRETPNVHVIVETMPGRKRDENGVFVELPPPAELVREHSQFKHFYAAVPHGNTTQFHPRKFIDFAIAGKRVWENSRLVHKMSTDDFADPGFMGNVSVVAFLDGTGRGGTDPEVVDAISSSLPGVAHRFLKEEVYVGVARCGNGSDDQEHVDCSELEVSWLPDIKIYGPNEVTGISLLRGQFSDVRDVQIGE
ncbi:hypothetical protein ACHAWF_011305 [Thalassiosira exigua]